MEPSRPTLYQLVKQLIPITKELNRLNYIYYHFLFSEENQLKIYYEKTAKNEEFIELYHKIQNYRS